MFSKDMKLILTEDFSKNEISVSMRNLLIFYGRSQEDFVKKRFKTRIFLKSFSL